MVERTFPEGVHIPTNDSGGQACLTVVGRNAENGVTWVHSYVSADKKKTFCIYDGPNENAIRDAAKVNGLPIDAVTEVSVLDPYFYRD
jgi:hypothetical protein